MRVCWSSFALLGLLAGCNQLLGITNPTAGDATQGGDGRPDDAKMDAAIDAPPPCTTASAFGTDIVSPVGGTGVALTVGRFDAGLTEDVAIAITTDTAILHGDGAGAFTAGQLLGTPSIALVDDDFDLIGAREDLLLVSPTAVVVRQQSEDAGAAGTFLAAQPLTGPFVNADLAGLGQYGGTLVSDAVIHDDSGNTTFTSLGAAGTFSRGGTVGAAGDALVFTGQIDRQDDHDAVFVDAAGNVKLSVSNGSGVLQAPTIIATGATGRGVALGRFDDDLFLDLVVATSAGGVIYLQNSASPGVFTMQTPVFGGITGNTLMVADVNMDGLDDVVTETAVVMQCPTTRVFTQVEPIDAAPPAVLFDLDANGKPDLLRLSGTDLIVRMQ